MSLAHESAADLTETAFHQAQFLQSSGANGAIDKRWLLSTLYHEWTDRRTRSVDVLPKPNRAANRSLIAVEDAAQLDQGALLTILHGMKEELRLVLSLFYFEQLSYMEIAEVLDLRADTVLVRLPEAKRTLRQQLEEQRKQNGPSSSPHVLETKGGPSG